MNQASTIALGTISLLLSACAVGPDFAREENIPTTEHYINAPSQEEMPAAINQWWERINDPLLNSYVEQLLEQNLELKEATERVIQAGERVTIEHGGHYPTLGIDGDASRGFTSTSLNRTYSTKYNAKLASSWQLDLFGKIRRAEESAQASFEASSFDQQALAHSLIADLLRRRIGIAINTRLLKLAKENSKNRKIIYDLVKRRYDFGVKNASLSDVYSAEENYTSVQADIYEFERILAEETYRLDVLLGKKPGSTNPSESDFPILPPPRDVPTCLPADLLDRRPDLLAAELRLKAATADIGVAIADLYPSLALGSNIGFAASETSNLFTADRLVGSILGSITTRIFEGGRLRANIRLQESEARELSARYAGRILEAMREVETSLKAEQELTYELEKSQLSVESLRKAENVSQQRYRDGIETLREVLDIQQRRYSIEQNWLRKQQQKWDARIALYLALGGDWLKEPEENISCQKQTKETANG